MMTNIEQIEEPRDLFSRWFGDFTWPRFAEFRRPELWTHFESGLRVEEYREGDAYVVRAEMPGIDPDKDVDLSVSDHTLRIRVERKEEKKTQEEGGFRSEFRYGAFSRALTLPVGASADDVKAMYKDGILEVRVQVNAATAEASKIPVTRV